MSMDSTQWKRGHGGGQKGGPPMTLELGLSSPSPSEDAPAHPQTLSLELSPDKQSHSQSPEHLQRDVNQTPGNWDPMSLSDPIKSMEINDIRSPRSGERYLDDVSFNSIYGCSLADAGALRFQEIS